MTETHTPLSTGGSWSSRLQLVRSWLHRRLESTKLKMAANKAKQDPFFEEAVARRFARRDKTITEKRLMQLGPRQLYHPPALRKPAHLLPDPNPIMDRTTPVASMGSCFAREVMEWMIANGYNYLRRGDGSAVRHGSAAWERVFNSACIRQEIARAFGKFTPLLLEMPDGGVIDPHRWHVRYASTHEANAELSKYVQNARDALVSCRIFIITLGLSEIWFDRATGKVFAGIPPDDAYDSEKHGFKVVSPSENFYNIKATVDALKSANPDIEIVLTVSPVPLRATFVDRSAVTSNAISKASLLWAALEIAQIYDWIHYFPSYEIVTCMDQPFEWDGRHVRKDAVAEVMRGFEQTFVSDAE